MFKLKSLSYVAALLGLALIVWLGQRQGLAALAGLLGNAGWPLLLLVPFHALPLLLDAMGWRVLLAPDDAQGRVRLPYLFWASAIREAVARLLPLASVGGELVGIRLAMLRGIDGAQAAAGIVVQLLLSIVNQYLFALLGLSLVLYAARATDTTRGIALGLLMTAPLAPLGLWLLSSGRPFQRLQTLLDRGLGAGLRRQLKLDGAALDAAVRAHLRQPRRLAASAAWEFAGLVVGCLENWIALRLLGHPVGLLTALSLEAASQAVRRVFFMMPAGLGVQEAGLLAVGPLLGVPADLAMALSLCKRLRDLLFGMPALASWYALEAAQRHNRRAP